MTAPRNGRSLFLALPPRRRFPLFSFLPREHPCPHSLHVAYFHCAGWDKAPRDGETEVAACPAGVALSLSHGTAPPKPRQCPSDVGPTAVDRLRSIPISPNVPLRFSPFFFSVAFASNRTIWWDSLRVRCPIYMQLECCSILVRG